METITFRKQLNGLTKVDMEEYFDEAEVENLYLWLDRINFSRPKMKLGKDFSDGVLVAEIVKHYFPRMVELHNYSPAANMKQKMDNWYYLNRKVLRRLDLDLSDEVIRALANGRAKVVEKVLMLLRLQVDKYLERQGRSRREIDEDFVQGQVSQTHSQGSNKPGNMSPRSERNNEQALVPYQVKTGRGSPIKLTSPRKYEKGEIPHNHPDRTWNREDPDPIMRSYTPQIGGATILTRYYLQQELGSRIYGFDSRRGVFALPFSDHVPLAMLEEKQLEARSKDETLKILNSKIRRLEHLLELKEIRIEDLTTQLAQVQGMYFVTKKSTKR